MLERYLLHLEQKRDSGLEDIIVRTEIFGLDVIRGEVDDDKNVTGFDNSVYYKNIQIQLYMNELLVYIISIYLQIISSIKTGSLLLSTAFHIFLNIIMIFNIFPEDYVSGAYWASPTYFVGFFTITRGTN